MNPEAFFDSPLSLARKMGLSLNYKNEGKLTKFLLWILLIWSYIVLSSAFIFRLNYVMAEKRSVEDLSDVGTIILGNIEAIMKISSVIVYRKKLLFLMETMKEKMKKGTWMTESTYHKTLKTTAKFIRIFKIIAFLVGLVNILPAISVYLFEDERIFPLKMEFFYDVSPSPYYEIAVIIVAYAIFCHISSFVILDAMFFVFGLCFVGHLRFIQEKIRQLNRKSTNLKEIIQLHDEACKYFDELNNIYAPHVIVKFLSIAIVVCFCGFLITESKDIDAKIQGAFVIFASLTSFMIYTAIGTKITTTSHEISTAVYENWMNFPRNERNFIIILMIRSQRELTVKTGIFEASLERFLDVVTSGFSYIALLKTFDQ